MSKIPGAISLGSDVLAFIFGFVLSGGDGGHKSIAAVRATCRLYRDVADQTAHLQPTRFKVAVKPPNYSRQACNREVESLVSVPIRCQRLRRIVATADECHCNGPVAKHTFPTSENFTGVGDMVHQCPNVLSVCANVCAFVRRKNGDLPQAPALIELLLDFQCMKWFPFRELGLYQNLKFLQLSNEQGLFDLYMPQVPSLPALEVLLVASPSLPEEIAKSAAWASLGPLIRRNHKLRTVGWYCGQTIHVLAAKQMVEELQPLELLFLGMPTLEKRSAQLFPTECRDLGTKYPFAEFGVNIPHFSQMRREFLACAPKH